METTSRELSGSVHQNWLNLPKNGIVRSFNRHQSSFFEVLFLLANIVTTSKALVTSSDALVTVKQPYPKCHRFTPRCQVPVDRPPVSRRRTRPETTRPESQT